AEKPTSELSAVSAADPFESTVDAPAPPKKAATPRKPRIAKTAAKTVKAEAAFAETAEEPVKQVRKIKVIKAKDKPAASVPEPAEPIKGIDATAKQPVPKPSVKAKAVKAIRPKVAKPAAKTKGRSVKAPTPEVPPATAEVVVAPAGAEVIERSRAFNILADVELPKTQRQNRARLLMQSPTKLYFYWSLKEDPWQLLHKTFGEAGSASYMLVLKLKDLERDVEEIHRVEREGNWWFEVEPDGRYTAEIGFYSPSRPYFRIVYSNAVETPRRGPSPMPARDADWRISANKFAQVLDVSGFQRDAFDVAMVGDDHFGAMDRSERALAGLVGNSNGSFNGISHDDIRYALLSLAAGTSLRRLRERIGSTLFSILEASASKIDPNSARGVLTEHFEIDDSDWADDEPEFTSIGGSRLNFPKRLRARHVPAYSPRYNPVSSFALR
ncbi:MAG TPA: DUF4912 domain-containing protein, partial [Pyrinomonadaceae bacterium]|nr:DUF4912 domain-containing protein [Pyrinomonadaceae bacterium]